MGGTRLGVPEVTSLALQVLRPPVFHWRTHSGLPNVTCPRPGQCLAIQGWDYRAPCPSQRPGAWRFWVGELSGCLRPNLAS